MHLVLEVLGKDGARRAGVEGVDEVLLVYPEAYQEGDVLSLSTDEAGYVYAHLEDSMEPVTGWLTGTFRLAVPFGEKRDGYSPRHFTGGRHVLHARAVAPGEAAAYRCLSLNPYDSHANGGEGGGLYPHASANVETRGEAQFFARNAVNGNPANDRHGPWPYESWGVGMRADAALTVAFGRPVRLDAVQVRLRADFPHDNHWVRGEIAYSDGTVQPLRFVKTADTQTFPVAASSPVTWARLQNLIPNPDDPSPFPALTQISFWG